MKHPKLSDRELKLLLVIIRCGKDAYGPRIAEVLREFTGESLSLGALHSALDRLEDRGLIESYFGEPTAVRGGRRKKIVRVKATGQLAVQHAVLTIEAMSSGLVPKPNEGGVTV